MNLEQVVDALWPIAVGVVAVVLVMGALALAVAVFAFMARRCNNQESVKGIFDCECPAFQGRTLHDKGCKYQGFDATKALASGAQITMEGGGGSGGSGRFTVRCNHCGDSKTSSSPLHLEDWPTWHTCKPKEREG